MTSLDHRKHPTFGIHSASSFGCSRVMWLLRVLYFLAGISGFQKKLVLNIAIWTLKFCYSSSRNLVGSLQRCILLEYWADAFSNWCAYLIIVLFFLRTMIPHKQFIYLHALIRLAQWIWVWYCQRFHVVSSTLCVLRWCNLVIVRMRAGMIEGSMPITGSVFGLMW